MRPARPVGIHDLPPAKRQALLATIDRHPSLGEVARVTAATPPPARTSQPGRWRCHQCGQLFKAAKDLTAEVVRHRDENGHLRYECDWS